MPLPQCSPDLSVRVALQHPFDQLPVTVKRLVSERGHRLIDRGHPQYFLQTGFAVKNPATSISIDAGASLPRDTE